MKTCHDNLFILDTQVTLFMSRNHAVYWALSSAKFCKFCFVFRYPCRVSLISEMIKNKCLKKRQIMPTLYFFSRALHVEHYQIYELCSHKRNFFWIQLDHIEERFWKTRLVCSCEDISVASQFVTVAERWNPLSPVFEISFFVWRDLTWLTILSHSSTKCSLFHIS